MESCPFSETEKQAIMAEINSLPIKTVPQREMMRELFLLSIKNPGEFHHYSTFVEKTYQYSPGHKLRTSNHINPLAEHLRKFLDNRNAGDWQFILRPKPIRRSKHWRLLVIPRNHPQPNTIEKSKRPSSEKPFIICDFGHDYKRGFPVFLTVAFQPSIFSVTLVSKWQPPTNVTVYPSRVVNYLKFKEERWRQQENANEQESRREGDTPVCAFKGFKLLENYQNLSEFAIDASLAYYSDFRSTNQLFAEWASSGEIEKAHVFMAGWDPIAENIHFHQNAVNPISVIVNLRTTDNKIILYRPSKDAVWQSPATGFLDPFLDVQRIDPFNISPRETAIRMATKRLRIPTPRQSIRWNAISRHHGSGGVSLLGEMEVGLSRDEVLEFFKKSKRRYSPLPLFLEFESAAIVSFLKKNAGRFQHILELSLALSLASISKNVLIGKLSPGN